MVVRHPVLDSDPVGSELLAGSESGKNQSGSEMNLKQKQNTNAQFKK
jgi:hypothetical protein